MSWRSIYKSDIFRKLGKYHTSIKDRYLNHDLLCIKAYRRANDYYKKNNKILFLFSEIKLFYFSNHFAFNISAKAEIGPGLFIGHNGPITINSKTVIGRNCNIGIGVTIGQENRGKRLGAPKIGDNVWIGTNAVVVGKIIVGKNVLIAPNSFVNFDVPSNSIVIGNPGKIFPCQAATDSYIENIIGNL
jgi:serine O-acetyltransferase